MNRNKLGVVLEWKYSDYIEWTVGVGKNLGMQEGEIVSTKGKLQS